MKKTINNFWFQTLALVFATATIGVIRSVLPSNEPGQISPLFFKLTAPNWTPALFALVYIGLFCLYMQNAGKTGIWIRYLLYGFIFLLFSFFINSMNGWNYWIPGTLGEYFNSCKVLSTEPDLLSQWTSVTASSNIHITVHPPGFCLYLIFFQQIIGNQIVVLAIVDIFLVGLSAIFIHKTALKVTDENQAYMLSLLYITAGNLIIYSGTPDALLCALVAASIYVMVKLYSSFNVLLSVILGIIISIGSFISYQFTFIFMFYLLMISIPAIIVRSSQNKTGSNFLSFLITVLTFICIYYLFFVLTGYNYIQSFMAQQQNSEDYYGAGWNILYWVKTTFLGAQPYQGEHRSYLAWLPGNILAYMFIIGPATAIMFWRVFHGSFRKNAANLTFKALSLATGFGFLLIALSGLVLGETERVWLYMLPFFVVSLGAYKELNIKMPDLRWVIMTNLLIVWILRFFTKPLVF